MNHHCVKVFRGQSAPPGLSPSTRVHCLARTMAACTRHQLRKPKKGEDLVVPGNGDRFFVDVIRLNPCCVWQPRGEVHTLRTRRFWLTVQESGGDSVR